MFAMPAPKLEGRRGELFNTFTEALRNIQKDPYADIRRLSQFMPTSGQEAMRTGLKYTGAIGGAGAGLAALASLLGHLQAVERRNRLMRDVFRVGGVPGREMPVPFKFASDEGMEKQGVGLGTAALVSALIGVPLLYGLGSSGLRHGKKVWRDMFTPTSNPLTHPAAVPLVLGGSVALTAGSYALFNKLFERMRKRRREREMEQAEKDFESALRSQYESPKAASIGEAVDGLAEAYVSGELREQLGTLEKRAQYGELPPSDLNPDPFEPDPWYKGWGSGAVGLYATLALLLALGGGMGAYTLAKKRDISRQKRKALEQALRRRALASPPQFVVEKPTELAEEPV
jgi:hypothetical protein